MCERQPAQAASKAWKCAAVAARPQAQKAQSETRLQSDTCSTCRSCKALISRLMGSASWCLSAGWFASSTWTVAKPHALHECTHGMVLHNAACSTDLRHPQAGRCRLCDVLHAVPCHERCNVRPKGFGCEHGAERAGLNALPSVLNQHQRAQLRSTLRARRCSKQAAHASMVLTVLQLGTHLPPR